MADVCERNGTGVVPAIQRALVNMVENGRLLQSFLFSGQRRTEKTSTDGGFDLSTSEGRTLLARAMVECSI